MSIVFELYQVENVGKTDYAFRSLVDLPENVKPDLKDYKLVYTGKIKPEKTIDEYLENIFYVFNCMPPQDYSGRSVSISDIVKIDEKYYYCDNFGWGKIEI